MSFDIVAVRDDRPADRDLYPALARGLGGLAVALEAHEQADTLVVTATAVTVRRLDDGRLLARFPSGPAKVVLTPDRVIVQHSVPDRGGRICGHIRLTWLEAVGGSPAPTVLAADLLRLVVRDETDGQPTRLALDIALEPAGSCLAVAQSIARRAAASWSQRRPEGWAEAMQALSQAPVLAPLPGGFSLYRMPLTWPIGGSGPQALTGAPTGPVGDGTAWWPSAGQAPVVHAAPAPDVSRVALSAAPQPAVTGRPVPAQPMPDRVRSRRAAVAVPPEDAEEPDGGVRTVARAPRARRSTTTPGRVRLVADGVDVPVDGPVVLGRRPSAPADHPDSRLVPLTDPDSLLSRSHALVLPNGEGGATVTDLGSVNGTWVLSGDDTSVRLKPHTPADAPAGSTIRLSGVLVAVVA